jgi:hypothetical protein
MPNLLFLSVGPTVRSPHAAQDYLKMHGLRISNPPSPFVRYAMNIEISPAMHRCR